MKAATLFMPCPKEVAQDINAANNRNMRVCFIRNGAHARQTVIFKCGDLASCGPFRPVSLIWSGSPVAQSRSSACTPPSVRYDRMHEQWQM